MNAREQRARRRIAFITLVPVGAMLLFATFMSWLIAGQARELSETTSALAENKRQLTRVVQETKEAVEAKQRELAEVQTKIDQARARLETTDGRPPSPQALESAVDSLIQAGSAADDRRVLKPIELERLRTAVIAQLFDPSAAVRVRAYGLLLPRYKDDSSMVPEVLRAAEGQQGNANGIYNALVVLSHMNAAALGPHAKEIRAFAEKSKAIGPRVAARAAILELRIKN